VVWKKLIKLSEELLRPFSGQKTDEVCSTFIRNWTRMEKMSWTDRVKNEEVLHGVKEERNILLTMKRAEVKWIGHILRRNCLLKHVVEEKIE
jgi:hypothetical protein